METAKVSLLYRCVSALFIMESHLAVSWVSKRQPAFVKYQASVKNCTCWTVGSLIHNTEIIKSVAPALVRAPRRHRVVLLNAVQNSRKYLTPPRNRQIPPDTASSKGSGGRRGAKHQTTAAGKTSRICFAEEEEKKNRSEREYLRTVKRWRAFDPRQDGRGSRGWRKKKEKQPLLDA